MSTGHDVFTRLTDPGVPRTRYGSPLWPHDPQQAWFMLCDLACVAPDTQLDVEALTSRLREYGERTQRRTVERLYAASRQATR